MAAEKKSLERAVNPLVYVGIAASLTSLLFGFLIGIATLGYNDRVNGMDVLVSDIRFHPEIMVFGVIAGLFITEKADLMSNFHLIGRVNSSLVNISLLFSGVFITSLGASLGLYAVRLTGLLLVTLAGIVFFYYMTSRKNPGERRIKWIFGGAISAMVSSAILSSAFPVVDDMPMALLILSFPILYVLAERVELGFVRGMPKKATFLVVAFAWAIVLLLSTSVLLGSDPSGKWLFDISALIFLGIIGLLLRYDPAFRKSPRSSRLQAFMKRGVIISYIWIVTGILLFLVRNSTNLDILGPATHAIALGFLGTFIVAHSPVIFPLILKKKANPENVTMAPIVLITMATFLRVTGDILLLSGFYGNVMSYASAYILIAAILAFLYNIRRIMVSSEKEAAKTGVKA